MTNERKKIFIINGPNLNMLGKREPHLYGNDTLDDIRIFVQKSFQSENVQIDWFQSNIEGELVEKIHTLISNDYSALIINPGGYTHSSVAIHDALKMLNLPVIEVHLTLVHNREEFRQKRVTTCAVQHTIEGFGKLGYYLAIHSLLVKFNIINLEN